MKNIVKLLLVAVCIISCSIQSKQETPKKVYETTWMELTKTDSGYVVYNYPDLEDDNFKTPQKIVLKGDSIIWITYSEMPIIHVIVFKNWLMKNISSQSGIIINLNGRIRKNILPSGQYIMEMKEFYRIVSI